MRQGDNSKQSHYFWATVKALFIEENVAQMFAVLLGRPTLLLFVHCVCYTFSLDLLAGYEITMFTYLPRLSPYGLNPALP